MSELDDLYQEILLDHYRRPRNFGPLEGADREVEGYNPLCGDRLRLQLRLDDGRIAELRFEGSGCAISTASASMMTEAARGLTVPQALDLARRFQALVTGAPDAPPADELGELAALGGVREFPMRVKCATLAWHALRSALTGKDDRISTEEPVDSP
jgi:nitrogen fixation NifU-like protein